MSDEVVQTEQEDEADSSASMATPAKKCRTMCRYQASWADKFPWSSKVAGNVFAVKCLLCRKTVSVEHGGSWDLIQHEKTESHKRAVHLASTVKHDAVNASALQVCSLQSSLARKK